MQLEPERIASLISAVGSDDFASALLRLFDPEYQIVNCAAYERVGPESEPNVILCGATEDVLNRRAAELAKSWAADDFRVDPVLTEYERHVDDEPSANYFDFPATRAPSQPLKTMLERYYEPLRMGEEVTYMIQRGSRVMAVSLWRDRRAGKFHPRQREQLEKLDTLMLSSAERHARLAAQNAPSVPCEPAQVDWPAAREEKFVRLRSALLMDERRLTLREAEICAYIVMGYTAVGISLMLGISLNTVATHRKRAYAKLQLSSQTELFNVCLKHCI